MSQHPPVSVALPVAKASQTLRAAFDDIAAQTHTDLEILLILNGADDRTRDVAEGIAAEDERVRILHLEAPSLPAALNLAIREAGHDLVARMDADDRCPANRLALQADAMRRQPTLAALGCAWELAAPTGEIISTVRPPTDPGDLRWRLMLGNMLAHGSMMLRKEAVIAAGLYDESLLRAQDYDLWLRLSRTAGIAALPDVLYTHITSNAHDPGRSTADQSHHAARAMLDAWRSAPPDQDSDLAPVIADALTRDRGPDDSRRTIESILRDQPTREALMAWLWMAWNQPAADRPAYDAARCALLRETGARLRQEGVNRIWLWGAGDHTRWLLDHRNNLDLEIAGLIDDHAAGQHRFGYTVASPDALTSDDIALISSDWREGEIWDASHPVRARGVRVERLYADARDGARSPSVSTRSCA